MKRKIAFFQSFKPVICIMIAVCFISAPYHVLAAPVASILYNDQHITYTSDSEFSDSSFITTLSRLPAEKRTPALKHYLDSLGYFNAVLDSLSQQCFPGKRTIVSGEVLKRADSIHAELLGSSVYPKKFNRADLQSRAAAINRVYAENGYPFANISADLTMAKAPLYRTDTIMVVFTIDADQRCVFGKPLLKGDFKTSEKILIRDMPFTEGDLFDIKKVEHYGEKLKSRSYVNNVTFFAPLLLSDSVSGDSVSVVTVPFGIQDKSGLGLEGAVGFESKQGSKPELIGNAQLSLLNVFSFGEMAQFRYAGDKTRQQFDVSVTKPWLFRLPVQVGVELGMEVQKEEYGYIYGKLKVVSEINDRWMTGFGLSYNEINQNADGVSGTFYGGDFLLYRIPELYKKGVLSKEISIEAGSGISRKERNFSRSHIDCTIGAHVPLFTAQSIMARLTTKYILTDEKRLLPLEMNRVGGYNSIRGYADNELAFRSIMYGQLEGIHYFSDIGSLFIFSDGGIGFENEPGLSRDDYRILFGYGLGMRIPSRLGLMELEWARNYQDRKNWGRIHVRFQNELSRKSGKKL